MIAVSQAFNTVIPIIMLFRLVHDEVAYLGVEAVDRFCLYRRLTPQLLNAFVRGCDACEAARNISRDFDPCRDVCALTPPVWCSGITSGSA